MVNYKADESYQNKFIPIEFSQIAFYACLIYSYAMELLFEKSYLYLLGNLLNNLNYAE